MSDAPTDTGSSKEVSVALPYEWCLKKLLGPTLDQVGLDLAGLYSRGKELIITTAAGKIKDLEDGKSVNLRVARDVFWNGSYSEEAICAEYFGGILAASRTDDGKDDAAIYYVDIIKSMSSRQLHLHYVIYDAINIALTQDSEKKEMNVGQSSELHNAQIWFVLFQLEKCGLKPDIDLAALHQLGLIEAYETAPSDVKGAEAIAYTMVTPTTLGIHLYTIAFNELDKWRQFPTHRFGSLKDIKTPENIFASKEKMDQAIETTLATKN